MSTFVDFIQETTVNPDLGSEFVNIIKTATPEKLANWFKEKYFEISRMECEKILSSAKGNIKDIINLESGY